VIFKTVLKIKNLKRSANEASTFLFYACARAGVTNL
jgi:hypothetical protein